MSNLAARALAAIGPHVAGRGAVCVGIAVVTLATAGIASAIDEVAFSVDSIDGAGWRAQDLAAEISLRGGATHVRARIASVRLPGGRELSDVRIDCPDVEISIEALGCKAAIVRFATEGLDPQSVRTQLRYGRRDGALDVRLTDIRLAEGAGTLQASLTDQGWTVAASLRKVPVRTLLHLAKEFVSAPQLSADAGSTTLELNASGAGAVVQTLRFDGALTNLSVHNDSGSVATEKLAFAASGALNRAGSTWRFTLDARSREGQLYSEPVFVDFGAQPLALNVRGHVDDEMRATIEHFSVDQSDVVRARGRAVVHVHEQQPVRSLDLDLQSLQFPGMYERYLQPFLLDTNFKSMKTAGVIAGSVRMANGVPEAIDLSLDNLAFDDGQGAFALEGLRGRWSWRDERQGADGAEGADPGADFADSHLQWRRGSLLGLDLGASELHFTTRGRQFRLLEPARIPLLDGALALESFRIRAIGTPQVAFMVDASLEPVSAERLCRAFGWPEFGGQVSGALSKLRMREGVVTLGAELRAQVFDGTVSINDLRLEQPFGQWPRFYATISLDDLDLELVTRAFSFGRITGRLSGSVNALQLFNWSPVAFDAQFHTPENDRSRRRISQRAVENIGAIGGGSAGVTAALSSGFLRFFDDFNYDRLGWSCRLENGVCRMGGVGPAPAGGYYLVRGRGLPRIDVIGNSERVDWTRLVRQLKAIAESEGPVVR